MFPYVDYRCCYVRTLFENHCYTVFSGGEVLKASEENTILYEIAYRVEPKGNRTLQCIYVQWISHPECVGEYKSFPFVSAKTHLDWHLGQEIDGNMDGIQ
jgi:hypothetical protein